MNHQQHAPTATTTQQLLNAQDTEDKYKITHKELPVPVRIYADFEASQKTPEELDLRGFDRTISTYRGVSYHPCFSSDVELLLPVGSSPKP